jgi:hypothetical protein
MLDMNFKAILGALLFAGAFAQAAVTEFNIKIVGPQSVYRGYPLQLHVTGVVRRGTDTEFVSVYLDRLPAGITASWIRPCCGDTLIYRVEYAQVLTLKTEANAPLGRNTVTITFATAGGVRAEATHVFNILEAPAPTTPASSPAEIDLPAESLWRQHTIRGNVLCYQDTVPWEGGVWYYDGTRVFYNLNDIARSESFASCAEFQNNAYRNYVLENNGLLQGYRYFPHGLAMHYQKTADPRSLRALRLMLNSAYTKQYMPAIDPAYVREISYGLDILLENERLGWARQSDFTFVLEALIGHLEMFFVSRQAQWQPFMVGLASEALISYWEVSRDPRILPLLRNAAETMWRESWSTPNGAFAYYSATDPTTYVGMSDLNLLIAPLYGWLYQQTHEEKFRTMGDMIFTDGVQKAWLDGGKQFSQNYRWGHKYIEWRRLAPTTAPVPPTQPAPPTQPTQPVPPSQPVQSPVLKTLTPNTGAGMSQTFTLVVEEASGAADLRQVTMTIDSTNKAAASCALRFALPERTVSLLNDQGTNWTTASLNGGGTLENSQCAISLSGLSIGLASVTATIQVPVSFRTTFAGLKNIYVSASDATQQTSGVQTLGTFTVGSALPTVRSVSPASSSGMGQTFTIVADEPSGAQNLSSISLVIDSATRPAGGCAVTLSLPSQSVTLVNDYGWTVVGNIGSPRIITNSQCSIPLSSVSVSQQGTRVTATLTVMFDSSYRGQKNIYVNATNSASKESGLAVLGTFNVTGSL